METGKRPEHPYSRGILSAVSCIMQLTLTHAPMHDEGQNQIATLTHRIMSSHLQGGDSSKI